MMKGLISGAVTRLVKLLMGAGGAGIIGFLQAGANSVLLSVQRVLDLGVYVESFGAKGDGVVDDTQALQRAINEVARRKSGTLSCASGASFKITAPIDFSVLGGEHRAYEIDFRGAEFIWGGALDVAADMFKVFNNKSLTVKNFSLIGSPGADKSAVTGLKVDSLQPFGADLLVFSNFRITKCNFGIALGSVGADQNRVSDIRIEQFVLEGCGTGLMTRSTNVDSLIMQNGIVSGCAKGINLNRAGFTEFNTVTGYACDAFFVIDGPIGPVNIINSQSEPGGLVGPAFLYRNNYTASRTGTITLVGCNVDDKIWLDYNAQVGADVQVLTIVGGYVSDMSIDAPDAVVNLVGATQVAGRTIVMGGANSRLHNQGSMIYGDVIDYAHAKSDVGPNGFSMGGDGLITQWGTVDEVNIAAGATVAVPINFVRPFNQVFSVVAVPRSTGGSGIAAFMDAYGTTLNGATVKVQNTNAGAAQAAGVNWIAYGK